MHIIVHVEYGKHALLASGYPRDKYTHTYTQMRLVGKIVGKMISQRGGGSRWRALSKTYIHIQSSQSLAPRGHARHSRGGGGGAPEKCASTRHKGDTVAAARVRQRQPEHRSVYATPLQTGGR